MWLRLTVSAVGKLRYTPRKCSGEVGKLSGCGLGFDAELRDQERISSVMGAEDMSEIVVVRMLQLGSPRRVDEAGNMFTERAESERG